MVTVQEVDMDVDLNFQFFFQLDYKQLMLDAVISAMDMLQLQSLLYNCVAA